MMLGHWPHIHCRTSLLNQQPKIVSDYGIHIELANIKHFGVTTTVSNCFQKRLNVQPLANGLVEIFIRIVATMRVCYLCKYFKTEIHQQHHRF